MAGRVDMSSVQIEWLVQGGGGSIGLHVFTFFSKSFER